jgi:hypothetical protein
MGMLTKAPCDDRILTVNVGEFQARLCLSQPALTFIIIFILLQPKESEDIP